MRIGLRARLVIVTMCAWSTLIAEEPDEGFVACNIGPVVRVFGGNEWNIFSCTAPDQLVVVSAPGNPAMPFYFVLYIEDGERRLSGEGNGSKEASAAAYEDLQLIAKSEERIAALIAETRNAPGAAE